MHRQQISGTEGSLLRLLLSFPLLPSSFLYAELLSAPWLTSTKLGRLALLCPTASPSHFARLEGKTALVLGVGVRESRDCCPSNRGAGRTHQPRPSDLPSNCFYYRSSKTRRLYVLYGWLRAAGRLVVRERGASPMPVKKKKNAPTYMEKAAQAASPWLDMPGRLSPAAFVIAPKKLVL